jgi:hypothetical protein
MAGTHPAAHLTTKISTAWTEFSNTISLFRDFCKVGFSVFVEDVVRKIVYNSDLF